MASIGLIIGATVLLKITDKRLYMLTCLLPLAYLFITINYAGYWMTKNVYLNHNAAGYIMLDGVLSIIMLVLGELIIIKAIKKWMELWNTPNYKINVKTIEIKSRWT